MTNQTEADDIRLETSSMLIEGQPGGIVRLTAALIAMKGRTTSTGERTDPSGMDLCGSGIRSG